MDDSIPSAINFSNSSGSTSEVQTSFEKLLSSRTITLAKVMVLEDNNFSKLVWTSEVEPDEFEKLIADGMESSIEMIKKILE